MKKIIYFLFFVSFISYSQDISTKNNTKLAVYLKDNNILRDIRIKNYIINNIDSKRYLFINNELVSEIFDIIDNHPVYRSIYNINSSKSTRTNFLNTGGNLGLNLDGADMIIGVWDGSPVRSTHQEFFDDNSVSRVSNPDQSASNPDGNHATHVAGTLIAKGIDANAKGMAPMSLLVSYDWDLDDEEVLNEASNNGLLISNHSYGIPVLNLSGSLNAPAWMMGNYNSDAKTWDDIAFNNPYFLMVAAAGNDGNSTYTGGLAPNFDKLTGNKNSKNNLVVANANNPLINPDGSGDLLNLFINTSSSQGPTDDGRIKPDITGDGTSVYSSSKTSDFSYQTLTGTSMASPNVAGTLILLQELYSDLYSNFMRSSTLKALVCHTADDDNSSPGPDPIFGWGLLNSKKAAELILNSNNNISLILESNLNDSNIFEYIFNCSGGETLEATICWTDPSGIPRDGQLNNSTPALINDLDIRIINIDNGQIFYPWKLDLSNVQGHAIKGDNLVDNIEKIKIDFPIAGSYKISISHKGSLSLGHQNYSLILSGDSITLSNDDNYLDNTVVVFPNPFKNILNIQSSNMIKNIEIFNVLGEKVYFQEKDIFNTKLNLEYIKNGAYFLNIESEKGVRVIRILK